MTLATDTASNPASALTGEPQWLAVEPDPVYAVLHLPTDDGRTRLAALILPAFGWDNECSYRRRRVWATQLAEAGIAAARFDFPGSENSAGSPLAEHRPESWIAATIEAARWLRERSGCERLTAIGAGLGGLIACEALAREAPIDDLVLWGVRASGRSYVRELRAYAAVTARERVDGVDDLVGARADGALGIGGHVMAAQTAEDLSAIDLTALAPSDPSRRRALLIGRDTHGVDRALSDHLKALGVEVTTLDSDEYKGMMSPPDLELKPVKTMAGSIDWMLSAPTPQAEPPADAPLGAAAAKLKEVCFDHEGVALRERILELDSPDGRMVGILTEPAGGERAAYCLVTVNSGALRHTGPNRMFVEIGRRAAAAGIPAARFDLPGLGDADGRAVKSFDRTADDDPGSLGAIAAICDHIKELGVADRFVASGFSLGGYLTVRMATAESALPAAERRLIGAISINPTGFSWTIKQRNRAIRDFTAMAGPDALMAGPPERASSAPTRRTPSRVEHLRRALEAKARHRLARSELLWSLEHRREITDLRRGLEQLRGSGIFVQLLLSKHEPLLRMLGQPRFRSRLTSAPNVKVERLSDDDHLLRPLWIQEVVIERVVDALVERGATHAT